MGLHPLGQDTGPKPRPRFSPTAIFLRPGSQSKQTCHGSRAPELESCGGQSHWWDFLDGQQRRGTASRIERWPAGIQTRARHQHRRRKELLEFLAMGERHFCRICKGNGLVSMRNACATMSIVRQQPWACIDSIAALIFRFSERTKFIRKIASAICRRLLQTRFNVTICCPRGKFFVSGNYYRWRNCAEPARPGRSPGSAASEGPHGIDRVRC